LIAVTDSATPCCSNVVAASSGIDYENAAAEAA
jgi:hypothetical protein